jgi:hypothetical protein
MNNGIVPAGAAVIGIFGDARLKNALHFTVVSQAPLILEGWAYEVKKYEFPSPVVLVSKQGDTVLRGEAEAISVEKLEDGKARVFFGKTAWEPVDRRAYPRVNISLPVKIRAVYETEEETVISVAEGETTDISVGGSRIQVDHAVLLGSLVEFEATLNEVDKIKALGVVVHSDPDGYLGISFMDYLGATRFKLTELTRFKAA